MNAKGLIKADQSCLLIIDVQEKLIKAIHEAQTVIDNCAWLIQVATLLEVPVLLSEQYPRGLGKTVEKIRQLIKPELTMEKVHFSCVASPECLPRLQAITQPQIVVAGIETHVCVLQTAMNLLDLNKEVFIVADAVSSRRLSDKELALSRLRHAGIQIVSKEMVLFEWAHQAATPIFKQLSQQFLV